MKDIVYYYRDVDNKPIVTVCLNVKDGEPYCRGVALCSNLDMPNKASGRNRAIGRAHSARKRRETDVTSAIQRLRAKNILRKVWQIPSIFYFKSEWDVRLTKFEKSLIKSRTKNEKATI